MAATDQPLLTTPTSIGSIPIPQYFNPTANAYEAVEGANGSIEVILKSPSGGADIIASASADGNSGSQILAVHPTGYNGATYDKWRNNTEGVLLTSAARTATPPSTNQTNHNARGVMLTLNVTANPGGAETLTLVAMPVSGLGKFQVSFGALTTIAATNANYQFFIAPGASGTVQDATRQKAIALPLPRTWFAQVTHSGAGSWTYSLEYTYIV